MDELSTYDPFATPAAFGVYIGRTIAEDDARALALLAASSLAIRNACEWQVWPLLTDDVMTLDGRGGTQRVLPCSRVVDVASVVENGVTLVEGTDFDWSSDGILDRLGGAWWTRKRRGIVAMVSHGYATLPADLNLLAMQVAGRGWDSPLPRAREQAGQVSVQYAISQDGTMVGVELTEPDKLRLKAYRGGYR